MAPEPNVMMSSLVVSLPERTGRTLEQWIELIKTDGPDALDQKAVRNWLKTEHGLPQNTQWTVAHMAALEAGWVPPSTEQYVAALYSGKKAALRPLHDQLSELILSLDQPTGDDAGAPGNTDDAASATGCHTKGARGISVEGRGTYIPFIRRTQFAAVAPGSYGRLRVGVRLRDGVPTVPGVEIEEAKNFAQATHCVHLSADATREDVAALEPLLRAAYEQNG